MDSPTEEHIDVEGLESPVFGGEKTRMYRRPYHSARAVSSIAGSSRPPDSAEGCSHQSVEAVEFSRER